MIILNLDELRWMKMNVDDWLGRRLIDRFGEWVFIDDGLWVLLIVSKLV